MAFGELLDRALVYSGLSKQMLCRHVSETYGGVGRDKTHSQNSPETKPRFSTPESVKEHLRHLHKNGARAIEYDALPEIIQFFKLRGCPEIASYVEHAAFQQSFERGLLADLYPPGNPLHKKVWWAYFPSCCSPSRVVY